STNSIPHSFGLFSIWFTSKSAKYSSGINILYYSSPRFVWGKPFLICFNNYVHAVDEIGYFDFENLPFQKIEISENDLIPELMIPGYNSVIKANNDNSHAGKGLQTLGYRKGIITKTAISIRYHQQTWKENYYEVLVQ
ncbi:MAG: hypothetical protein WKI04_17590, partial [Ferruginibacter sp.]